MPAMEKKNIWTTPVWPRQTVRVVHGREPEPQNAVHKRLRQKLKYVKVPHLGEFGEGDSGVTVADI